MCCDCCHREIPPGTERTLWHGVKHWAWVCATCFVFGSSAIFGQITPPEVAPPIFIDVRAPSIYTNTLAGTFTNASSASSGMPFAATFTAPASPPVVNDLPLWASPEQRKEHHKRFTEDFKLTAANRAKLRKR